MATFSLHVQNLRALRRISWTAANTSVIVGANGSGKTTLVLVLKLLRAAYDRGLPEAVTLVLGGSHGLRHRAASESEPIEVGVDLDDISWRVQLTPRGASVDSITTESLRKGGETIFSRDPSGPTQHRGEAVPLGHQQLSLRAILDAGRDDPDIEKMANLVKGITAFHDPNLWALRTEGSRTTEDSHLHSRGLNAITMLRRWFQERPNRHRYEFVKDGLKAAFPAGIADLDFQEAGQTLVAQFYAPGREAPTALAVEANGVLAMLVLLCDLAAAKDGGVVAIDEPENGLHPYAIRRFFDRATQWARNHDLKLILTTHSPVLLNLLNSTPEDLFVLRPNAGSNLSRADEVRNREWLAKFQLGDLHADGELGSNEDVGGA